MERCIYVDNHAHLNFDAYDADRDEAAARAQEKGVMIVNVGVDKKSSEQAVELADRYQNMRAVVGQHPTDTNDAFDAESYRELLKHPKVIAIGECGLDYFRMEKDTKDAQKEIFEAQIKLSLESGKPLMLHIRDGEKKEGERGAYEDSIEILKKYPGVRGNVHFFAGSIDVAKQFLDLGFTLSFTGVITFAKEYEELVKFIPLDRILSETDCPYVAPKPYRGSRNEPAYVVEVVKKIAEIKALPLEEVAKQLLENSRRLFGW